MMPGAALADPSLDRTLIALADPTRRAILARLAEGETRVTDLAEPFPISLNSVSKHIRMLERARLVRRRISGKEHLLSFNREPLDEAALWIERQRALWSKSLVLLDRLLSEEDRAAEEAPVSTQPAPASTQPAPASTQPASASTQPASASTQRTRASAQQPPATTKPTRTRAKGPRAASTQRRKRPGRAKTRSRR